MEFARSPSDNVAFERVDQIKLLGDKKKKKNVYSYMFIKKKKRPVKTNLKAALI